MFWSRLQDKLRLNPRRKAQLRNACSGLKVVLGTAKDVADNASVPGLSFGISGLILVLDIAEKMGQNAEDIEALSDRIRNLLSVLRNVTRAETPPKEVTERIEKLGSTLASLSDEVQKCRSRPFFKRMLNYSEDARLLAGQIKKIVEAIEAFNLATTVRIEAVGDNIQAGVQVRRSTPRQIISRLFVRGSLPHAVKAAFEAEERELCWDTTRTSILSEISQWTDIDGVKLTAGGQSIIGDPGHNDSCIFWMNGSAGTGKTTIAATVAHSCSSRTPSALGASFFCSRDDVDCSNLDLIFTTIAYQLAHFHPGFAAQISLVREANPDIGYAYPEHQLKTLIVEPLKAVRDSFPPCVIVLDALDECKDTASTSTILAALSNHVTNLFPLKFFITSRPEPHITGAMSSSQLGTHAQKFHLHEVELPVVQRDIQDYLLAKLSEIGQTNKLHSWPSQQDVRSLVKLSAGLFIFASTAVKFIAVPDFTPQEQLQIIFNVGAVTEAGSPSDRLDRLYTQVLEQTPKRNRPELRRVIGSIVLLRDPLPRLFLAQLLELDPDKVGRCLLRLQSVVLLPTDDSKAIRILHPSFFDFLSSPGRCLISELRVQIQEQHSLLAEHCLNTMIKGLHRDMCQIRDPSLLNSEIAGLSTQIAMHIPLHLQYACRHWAYHISNGVRTDTVLDLLNKVVPHHLLHWIEVCSLLGDLQNALLSVATVHQVLLRDGTASTTLTNLLSDSGRFMRAFFAVISVSSLQVYHSALLFTPTATTLRQVYGSNMNLPVKAYNAALERWSPCLRTIDTHNAVPAVAFSPDGTHIVSGSEDKTVRIWDVITGTELQRLQGHSDCVGSVEFSPDGTHIVSGSDDKRVHIWDVIAGTKLRTMHGHSDTVRSVAFSPDGKHVVSGSTDRTVRIWDVITGTKLQIMRGHSDTVYCVGFSPDGTHIVSGSEDKTVCIWNAATGTHHQKLQGHSDTVCSVAFSPNGTRVASGSMDKMIRIWDAVTGTELHSMHGHLDTVRSVAFSPDGTYVVSASKDKTVRIWNVITGTEFQTLQGHSDMVYCARFSPDETHIVSASKDKTVRIWDVVAGIDHQRLQGHSDMVCFVAFSPNGTRIASGSTDEIIRIWDAVTGTELQAMHGHSDTVNSVAFSPNGTYVVSGSKDKTVRIWDATTGVELRVLQGHSDSIKSVAFSPNGTYVVSGSDDKTARIWDATNGNQVLQLKSSGMIASVAFSPDGTRIVTETRLISVPYKMELWDARSGDLLDTTKDIQDAPSLAASLTPLQSLFSTHGSWHMVPYSKTQVHRFIFDREWLYCATHNRRLCWIPVDCRPQQYQSGFPCFLAVSSDHCHLAHGTNDGRVIIFDCTGLGSYCTSLSVTR
ncbi:WD40 repeat-like protein [Mycena venus]|uniref:WD40 repeat-like protein n=1 Tax=Mycena venus TaxID=2733690 RepID=A0A8H6X2R0_9AGAR|nr:WD40 repeat-like protein [Mycena venus]